MATTLTIPTGANMPDSVQVMDKSITLCLKFGRLGNTRKVSNSQVEVEADKTLIHVSKTLLDSKELAAIGSHDAHTMAWLKNICLPSPFFRAGVHLVPIPAIEKVEAFLADQQTKRADLIEAFLKVYEACKDKAQTQLNDLYNPNDYPTIQRVRASFSFEWQWVTFSTPSKLKEISAGFFQAEQAKAQKQWAEASEEITLLLRTQMKDLVDHMVEAVQPADDGTKKRFHGTTVTKLAEFMENFDMRNVSDDKELAAVITSAKMLLKGVDADAIRKNEAVRDGVAQSFTLVKQCLDALVDEAPSRKITLEEE